MNDIWSIVSTLIPKGEWKNFIFTCKLFYSFNTLEQVIKRSNHLLTLIDLLPHKDWSYFSLALNINITTEFIFKHLDKFKLSCDVSAFIPKLNWDIVSKDSELLKCLILGKCSYVTWDNILSNPQIKWCYGYVSVNPNVTLDIISNNLDFPWTNNLGINKNVTLEFVLKYPDLPWNWQYLSQNRYITTIQVIENHTLNWVWEQVSNNIVKPEDTKLIFKNSDLPWDWESLSYVLRVTNEDIKFTTKWNDRCLSGNKSITWKLVVSNPQIKWDYDRLIMNPNITLDIIMSNLHLFLNFESLSYNPSLTLKQVLDNPKLPWNWYVLSSCMNVTWIDIFENPDLPWDWRSLSYNNFLNCKTTCVKENGKRFASLESRSK